MSTCSLSYRLGWSGDRTRKRLYSGAKAGAGFFADLEGFYLAEERMKRYDESRAVPLADLLGRHGLDR